MTYNSKIMKHVDNPSNLGALDTNSKDVGTGFVGNAACGDMLKIQIKVTNGIIQDVKAKIFGCGCAIASTSLATEKLKGRTLEDAQKLTDHEIAEELGLPAIKLHCSVLAAKGVLRAIKNYTEKQDSYYEHSETLSSACSNLNLETSIDTSTTLTASTQQCSPVTTCCKTNLQHTVYNRSSNNEHTHTHSHPTQINNKYTLEHPFTLTPTAFERFWQILSSDRNATGIRIFSKPGGCAGNEYDISLEYSSYTNSSTSNDSTHTQPISSNTLDATLSTNYDSNNTLHNVTKYAYRLQQDSFVRQIIFFIPRDSLMFLIGLDIDYIISDVSAQFIFTNKNFQTCGCGSSFTA